MTRTILRRWKRKFLVKIFEHTKIGEEIVWSVHIYIYQGSTERNEFIERDCRFRTEINDTSENLLDDLEKTSLHLL